MLWSSPGSCRGSATGSCVLHTTVPRDQKARLEPRRCFRARAEVVRDIGSGWAPVRSLDNDGVQGDLKSSKIRTVTGRVRTVRLQVAIPVFAANTPTSGTSSKSIVTESCMRVVSQTASASVKPSSFTCHTCHTCFAVGLGKRSTLTHIADELTSSAQIAATWTLGLVGKRLWKA